MGEVICTACGSRLIQYEAEDDDYACVMCSRRWPKSSRDRVADAKAAAIAGGYYGSGRGGRKASS